MSAARLDGQLITELRNARARLGGATPLAMKVTLEELDALFRIVDEVVELRRRLAADWEGELTADGREARETPPLGPIA